MARTGNGWHITALNGVGVGQLVLDDRIRLRVGSHEIELRPPGAELVEGAVEGAGEGAAVAVELGMAPGLLRRVVAGVRVLDEGVLRVGFADGARLAAPSAAERVAWSLAVRGTAFFAPRPGGGLTVRLLN
ncbi:DUF6188 family protein [Streptomyces radicis]|uniref:DUF6188 family protein n=1 Tax=Streptomyces radicis TaxID=1750517 RepID=UPI0011C4A56A|nr:DUF6188 family protein [Streptomyces radicis]